MKPIPVDAARQVAESYGYEDDERIIRETDELLDRLSAALAGGGP